MMIISDQLEFLKAFNPAEVTPCGSRVTCSPPPIGADEDYLVLLDGDAGLSKLVAYLTNNGWKWEGSSEHYQMVAGTSFMSWRKGQFNLIVTTSKSFAKLHHLATVVCKKLNLMDKADRITLFQAILYGKEP